MDDPFVLAGETFTSRLIMGTGGMPSLDILDAALEASGTEMTTVAMRRVDPAARGSILDVLARRGVRDAAEHRRLLHRCRRRADRAPGSRGARHELGEARGDRRRAHAAARPDRTPQRRRNACRRRLHRAALHERRPGARAPARAGRLRGRDAARLADRLRARHPQPAQHRADRRARRGAGRPRRRDRHGERRGAGDGAGLRRGSARLRGHPRAAARH